MENNSDTTKLKEINSLDYRFLYNQLKNRNLHANISHKKMPSYNEHIEFVKSKPYSKWYIINFKDRKAGSIYLSKENAIGIFLKKEFQGKNIATQALKLMILKNPRSRYLANINPKNMGSQKFFKKKGFKLIQYTYELIP